MLQKLSENNFKWVKEISLFNKDFVKISQKFPENDFKWVQETSQFNKDFVKIYKEHSDKEC